MYRSLIIVAALLVLSIAPTVVADRIYDGTWQFTVFVDWTPFVDSRDPTCVAGNDFDTSSGPKCYAPAPLFSGLRVGGNNRLGIPVDSLTIFWGDGNSDTYTTHANGFQNCFAGSQHGCDFSHFYTPRPNYYNAWVVVRAGTNEVDTSDHPVGPCFTALTRCAG